jgi:ribokinase
MRAAVVGHVDWAEFVRVDHVPSPGEIVRADESWQEPGGGGAVAAVQLARLAGECRLLTALADDALGRRSADLLAAAGVAVHAGPRPAPQRRALVHVDADGERTITVVGERMAPRGADELPWEELAEVDALYFAGGDAGALRAARAARVLVATVRVGEALREAGVELDALVGSGDDPGERHEPLEPAPRLVLSTHRSRGGRWEASDGRAGTWKPAEAISPCVNCYGAGGLLRGRADVRPRRARRRGGGRPTRRDLRRGGRRRPGRVGRPAHAVACASASAAAAVAESVTRTCTIPARPAATIGRTFSGPAATPMTVPAAWSCARLTPSRRSSPG